MSHASIRDAVRTHLDDPRFVPMPRSRRFVTTSAALRQYRRQAEREQAQTLRPGRLAVAR